MMVFCAPLRGAGGACSFFASDIGYMVLRVDPFERDVGGLMRRRESGTCGERVFCGGESYCLYCPYLR